MKKIGNVRGGAVKPAKTGKKEAPKTSKKIEDSPFGKILLVALTIAGGIILAFFAEYVIKYYDMSIWAVLFLIGLTFAGVTFIVNLIISYIVPEWKNKQLGTIFAIIFLLAITWLLYDTGFFKSKEDSDKKVAQQETAPKYNNQPAGPRVSLPDPMGGGGVKKIFTADEAKNNGFITFTVKGPEAQKIGRVYGGDEFMYMSPKNFMIAISYEGEMNECYHNKSQFEGDVRSFPFYNIPPEGVDIYIIGHDPENFEIKYKINKRRV